MVAHGPGASEIEPRPLKSKLKPPGFAHAPPPAPSSNSKPLVRTKSLPSGFVPPTSGVTVPRRLPALSVEQQDTSPAENSTARRLKFGASPSPLMEPASPACGDRPSPLSAGPAANTMWPVGNSTDDDPLASEGALAAAQISRRARPATSLGSRRSGLSGSVSASTLNRQSSD